MKASRPTEICRATGIVALLMMPVPSVAQTAEEFEAQYSREAMEQALQTRQEYALYGIHFDSGQAVIKPESSALLNDIATALGNFPDWNLRIVGHTDATGDEQLNRDLSIARAEAIRDGLISRGIQPSRLATAGFGEDRPIAGNDTPEGRALNRRVELMRFSDSAEAKQILKAMSDYLAGQERFAFDYDATLEVVTTDGQKLGLASSGSASIDRPERLRATRTGGFVDLEMVFDGATMSLLGRDANVYAQFDLPGTIDSVVDDLRDKYGRPLPAADLLVSNPYSALMSEVIDSKDLGSGVIGGMECDWLAFRTDDVDWQIWIAQGDEPYPCRYTITTKHMASAPQYTIEVRNWRTGEAVPVDDFTFTAPAGATSVDLEKLGDVAGELPGHFKTEK